MSWNGSDNFHQKLVEDIKNFDNQNSPRNKPLELSRSQITNSSESTSQTKEAKNYNTIMQFVQKHHGFFPTGEPYDETLHRHLNEWDEHNRSTTQTYEIPEGTYSPFGSAVREAHVNANIQPPAVETALAEPVREIMQQDREQLKSQQSADDHFGNQDLIEIFPNMNLNDIANKAERDTYKSVLRHYAQVLCDKAKTEYSEIFQHYNDSETYYKWYGDRSRPNPYIGDTRGRIVINIAGISVSCWENLPLRR